MQCMINQSKFRRRTTVQTRVLGNFEGYTRLAEMSKQEMAPIAYRRHVPLLTQEVHPVEGLPNRPVLGDPRGPSSNAR